MSDAEAVRYDRQIRLWGKSTQQQLMHTNVIVDGIAGVAAEAAKNLVLAGVRGIAVVDAAAVGAKDAAENFLMQGESGDTRAARALRSLHRLNPYVRVCGSPAELGPGGATVRVVAIASAEEGAACVAAAAASPPDMLVLHATLGDTAVALMLYGRLTAAAASCSLAEQWRRLVANPTRLAEKPAAYQRVILALYLRNSNACGLTFAAAAASAYALIDALHLQQLSAADVEAALNVSAAAASCVCATVAGTCIAQHLIRQIGALADAHDEPQSYRWLLCATESEVECLVGV